MTIDWNHFTPLSALGGGLLIGMSAALLLLFKGRIAGISGIVGGLLGGPFTRGEWAWRAAFVVGLIGAPLAWVAWRGGTTIRIDSGSGALIVAGLLVGLGTRIGGGCTSGHGVCGTARLSPRSLVATGLFMAAGMAVVALVRHGVAA